MALQDQLSTAMKEAMKSGDTKKVSLLRLLIASLKNAVIEKKAELTPDQEIAVLQKEHKKRKESEKAFIDGNRQELADNEAAEAILIEAYLPQQLSDEELAAIVQKIVQEKGAESSAFGEVMKLVMREVVGRADGARVSFLVKKTLQK